MYVSTITSNTISTSRKFIGTKGRGNGLGVGPSTMHAKRRDDHGSQSLYRLAARAPRSHAPGMFVVSEAEAAAIRTAFEQRGVHMAPLTPASSTLMHQTSAAQAEKLQLGGDNALASLRAAAKHSSFVT